jgi:hypothetical protein
VSNFLEENRQLIVIGNPGNKRTSFLQKARTRLGLPPAHLISYLDWLRYKGSPGELLRPYLQDGKQLPLIRLDSPGEQFEVERELIALGAVCAEEGNRMDPSTEALYQSAAALDAFHPLHHLSTAARISPQEARYLVQEQGRIYHPAQWFRGFCRLLHQIKQQAEALSPSVRWMNEPAEIALMFDKRRCHQLLGDHDVPVPPIPAALGSIRNYEELREAMRTRRMHRVFIKLAFGSSASGIAAYQINPSTGAEVMVTTIGQEYRDQQPVYYNAGSLRKYTNTTIIKTIVNWLCEQGVHVERWIEKASVPAALHKQVFDIRQLVVGGQACHRVARLSRTPITNLHLRNDRADPADIGLTPETINRIEEIAQATMALFSSSIVAGIDVLLSRGSLKPYIADINPFGDLVYDVQFNGCSTYEWEMTCIYKG